GKRPHREQPGPGERFLTAGQADVHEPIDCLPRRAIGEPSPVNRAVARGLDTDSGARLVIAKRHSKVQSGAPGFDTRIAVVAPAMVVAKLLVRARPLAVVRGELERRLMELEPSFGGVALSRRRPRGDQRGKGRLANLIASGRIVGPSEVRARGKP